MQRDNFYILLELPFHPPATDPAQIRAAIHTKHQLWTQQLDDPALRSLAQKNLDYLTDIEDVMLDADKRQQEAEAAQKLRETTMTRFQGELKVLEAKGYLLPRELSNLIKKYFPFGIDRNDIHRELQVPVTDTAPKVAEDSTLRALEQDKMRSIRSNLQIFATENLYTFLEKEVSVSQEELLKAANEKHTLSFASEDRSAELFAAQILAETARSIFAEPESRGQYDLALTVSQYPELNDLIDDEYTRASFVSSESLVRLVNFGVTTYHASVLDTEDYIRRYCLAYGISVDFMHHHIQCPNCDEMNPGDATLCISCAAPLAGTCPSCGAPFEGGKGVCANCGFLLGSMAKALEQFTIAERDIIEGSWSGAQRALEHATTYWPGHPRLRSLQEKIDALELRNIDYMQTIEDYLGEKRYYAAQTLVEEAKERHVRIPSTTVTMIDKAIADFEVSIAALQEKGNASFETLNGMLHYVADSIDLERMLAKYPPEPPARLTVNLKNNQVQIDWNASVSTGVIRYVLVRKENSVPVTAYDGDILYEGSEHTFVDETPPPLKSFYYSIFVKRGLSFSAIGAVAPLPIQIIPELTNLRILPANSGAQMTWDAIPALQSVNIYRKLGGDAPTRAEDGMALENDRLDGFTDMKLRNDVVYWYFITATYSLEDGSSVTSQGISQQVTPVALVDPIDQFYILPTSDGEHSYNAHWSDAEDHDVILLFSTVKPSYYLGEVSRITDLLFTYHRLTLENLTLNGARFSHAFSGGIYIFPVSVQGKVGVIGATRYLTNIPIIKNASYSIVEDSFYITADWPEGPIQNIVVSWKFGGYPTSLDEEGITTVTCSRRQYELDHGVHLPGLDRGVYYFSIFAAFETEEGKLIYSKAARLLVDNNPHQEIRYSIKHVKPFFSSQYTTTITVSSAKEFVIPKAVLVGKVGQMPLRITDGTPYFEVERERAIAESISFEYKTEKLPENLYLRWFYYDSAMYQTYRPLPARTVLLGK